MAEGEAAAGKSLRDFDPQKKPKRNKFALACAILASMTSILLGYGEQAQLHITPFHSILLASSILL